MIVEPMDTVKVNKRGANRVRHGHLWIYRSDVIAVDANGGSIVSVLDESGKFCRTNRTSNLTGLHDRQDKLH